MPKPGQLLTACIDTMRHSTKFSHADRKALLKRLDMAATRGVKFISPKAAALDTTKPMTLSDMRPPYPVTVLEGELFDVGNNLNVSVLVIARDTGEHVEINSLARASDEAADLFLASKGWMVGPLILRIPYSDASAHEHYNIDVTILLRDQMEGRGIELSSYKPIVRFYAAVCQLLANHEVETQDVLPDAKEARSRKIRGKAPLFTYKTLVVGAPKKRAVERSGGTHASPRSHLRRGYYRTSKKGVRHWVQACMVKGETPGFVHKDYRIEQQEGVRP